MVTPDPKSVRQLADPNYDTPEINFYGAICKPAACRRPSNYTHVVKGGQIYGIFTNKK
jgi:hypothetical protein